MNLQPQWRDLLARIAATDAVRNFGHACRLVRLEGNTLHLETNKPYTNSAAIKLVRAIAESSGAPVALNIRRLPSPNGIRYFSQPEEKKSA